MKPPDWAAAYCAQKIKPRRHIQGAYVLAVLGFYDLRK